MGLPLLVELVGVAGSGKSTIYAGLTEGEDPISPDRSVGPSANLRSRGALAAGLLVRALPAGLAGEGYPDWRQFRHMARLEGWARAYRREGRGTGFGRGAEAAGERLGLSDRSKASSPAVVLFDQGPVFRLAELQEFGPFDGINPPLAAWLSRQLRWWGDRLDLVVWLQADDETLLHRIQHREKPHPIKGLDPASGRALLGRYRAAYQRVLERFASDHGVRIVRIPTDQADVPSTVARARALFLGEVGASETKACP